MSDDVHTYRGRTLAEILPQIRAELGDDAVVLRRREGLAGGVGGFFAKAFVEVEARAGGPRIDVRDEDAGELLVPRPPAPAPAPVPAAPPALSDLAAWPPAAPPVDEPVAWPAAELPEPAAAAEALSAAAAAAPATPSGFARLLADAYAGGFSDPAQPVAAEDEPVALPPAPVPPAPSLFPDHVPLELERSALPALAAQENLASHEAAPRASIPQLDPPSATPAARTKAAASAEAQLVEAGLSPAFAAGLVAEATTHGLPFATPRSLRRLVREALVRRLPVPAPRPDHAVVALTGAAGCGRTTVAGRLAAAYAAGSDLEVRAIALGTAADGAELAALAGEAPTAVAATSAAAAAAHADTGPRALVVLDPGAVRVRDEAAVRALRRDLRAAGVTEVHLVLPATLSAPAARAVLEAARPLKPAGIVITHADEVPAGAVVELAATEGLPIAWQSTAGALGPADPASLAQEILP